MASWVIDGVLARGRRPGYPSQRVVQAEVDAWLVEVKALGVRSIICLLADDQLGFYAALPTDLASYYRQAGFEAAAVPARDYAHPPLSNEDLAKIWAAFQDLPKPVLVHCSAGIDRTGMAIRDLEQRLRDVDA
jgi:protein tyrosine phosphatase (PTP) superfamily phosphohydrolase (DUF442 family)